MFLHTCANIQEMRITIKDIAKKFDVHHSTVSRALRMDPRIKPETADKIRKYAKEKGYYLNLNALKLRGNIRNTIALIVPNINHRFFSNIINHLTDLAYQNNFVITIYQSNENYELECSFIERIIQQDVAGVIASISDKTVTGEHFKELMKMQIPLVFFDRVLNETGSSSVTTDNQEIMEQLIGLLITTGRKRIAHISGPDHINVFHDRNLGYHSAVRKHKLNYLKQIIIKDVFTINSGINAVMDLFSTKTNPDAIISTSFLLTMGIIRFLEENQIRIPEDVIVAGFGDNVYNPLVHPSIITIEQPEKEMASAAFKLLMEQLEANARHEIYNHKNIKLNSTIIVTQKII